MSTRNVGANALNAQELTSFVERIEVINEEIAALQDDVKDILKEASEKGLDKATIKKVISLRKKDKQTLAFEQEMLEAYLIALKMV